MVPCNGRQDKPVTRLMNFDNKMYLLKNIWTPIRSNFANLVICQSGRLLFLFRSPKRARAAPQWFEGPCGPCNVRHDSQLTLPMHFQPFYFFSQGELDSKSR